MKLTNDSRQPSDLVTPEQIGIPAQRKLLLAGAIVRFQITEGILDAGQHVRHKGPQVVNLLVVPVRFIEDTALADPLNVAQCVVPVGASRTRRAPSLYLPHSSLRN